VALVMMGDVFLTTTAEGSIIEIPEDYATIQEGINHALGYDTILVAPGTYVENITFGSKNIFLTSHFLYDQDPQYIFNTIIDGSNQTFPDSGSTVRIMGGQSNVACLQGFTITGGTGTLWEWSSDHFDRQGGGVLIIYSAPTIRYNYICDNHATNDAGIYSAGGGGIQIQQGSPIIRNNMIIANEGKYGAGIAMAGAAPTIKNNVIAYNYGGQKYGGSGIQINAGYNIVIENNTLVYNRSTVTGGGIRVFSASPRIRNNIIWYNEAPSAPQIYGYTTTYYCNVQGGGVTGEGNIDAEPQLTPDMWLYTYYNSPCIDAGDTATSAQDIENPALSDSAWWPSYGGLRNDIGAAGGAWAFPLSLAALYANEICGQVPFDISFNSYSREAMDSWDWSFGDGGSDSVQNPTHRYESPGLFDVSVQVNFTAGGSYTVSSEDLVTALADSLYGDTVETKDCLQIGSVIGVQNSLELDSLTIPVVYNGDLNLWFDSLSTAGCRTESFGSCTVLEQDSTAKTMTIQLIASSEPLEPGNGPVVKLYFTVDTSTAELGQTTILGLDGYAEQAPSFEGIISYTPACLPGLVVHTSCCVGMRGNIDGDPEEVIAISDLVHLVTYMFQGGPEPVCFREGNVDGDPEEVIAISDLVHLVTYMFQGGPEPASCP